MKIITFAAIKGGVGKTTIAYNFSEYLASKNHKVLMIDADSQCSLSQVYDVYDAPVSLADVLESNIQSPIKAEDVILAKSDNLFLLPSSTTLDTVENDLQTKTNKELLMYIWIRDNQKYLKQFDYIIIDCHPDFSIITQNMIATSDIVYSPIEPGEFSYNAKGMITARMDLFKKTLINPNLVNGHHQSYIHADLYFIGNRVKSNTESSREFKDKMLEDKQTIGFIPEKELLNKSTLFKHPLFTSIMSDRQKLSYLKNKKFYHELSTIFNKMSNL